MTTTEDIHIVLAGGKRVTANLRHCVIETDQPKEAGGTNTAPSPFDLFLASIGSCAGFYVQSYLQARNVSTEGVSLTEQVEYDANGALASIRITIHLPPSIPETMHDAIMRAASTCTVKKILAKEPRLPILVDTTVV